MHCATNIVLLASFFASLASAQFINGQTSGQENKGRIALIVTDATDEGLVKSVLKANAENYRMLFALGKPDKESKALYKQIINDKHVEKPHIIGHQVKWNNLKTINRLKKRDLLLYFTRVKKLSDKFWKKSTKYFVFPPIKNEKTIELINKAAISAKVVAISPKYDVSEKINTLKKMHAAIESPQSNAYLLSMRAKKAKSSFGVIEDLEEKLEKNASGNSSKFKVTDFTEVVNKTLADKIAGNVAVPVDNKTPTNKNDDDDEDENDEDHDEDDDEEEEADDKSKTKNKSKKNEIKLVGSSKKYWTVRKGKAKFVKNPSTGGCMHTKSAKPGRNNNQDKDPKNATDDTQKPASNSASRTTASFVTFALCALVGALII